MKPILIAAAAILASAWAVQPAAQNATVVAFTNVNVLPMDRDAVLRDQTVVVRNGQIEQIGAAARTQLPAGAIRVDGRGKFLMPALAEMHAHIPGGKAPDADVERTLFLYAVNGIGTIRGMLGDPRHLAYRERAGNGELFSPRIYTSGPSFSGGSAKTPETAAQMVVDQKTAGYDLLKIHPGLTRPVFEALAAKAYQSNIPFAGHVPLEVGLHRALDSGYRSIDHLDGYVEALAKDVKTSDFFGLNLINDVDESKLPALVEATKGSGVWMVPTMTLLENVIGDEDPEAMAAQPVMKHVVPQEFLPKWVAQKKNILAKYSAADRARVLALRRKIVKALFDAGVPFALGSDAPQFFNVPGFSIHRELKSMVQAGLTPFQALQMGTVNVARYFGTPGSSGTVAAGKRGDLLLLDANPVENIDNSTRIAGVILAGRWMPRADIQKQLDGWFWWR
jgi:imidazolonepropionase-like amidohydrolase